MKNIGYTTVRSALGKVGLHPINFFLFALLFLVPVFITDNYFLRIMVSAIYVGILGMGFDLSVGFIGVANWGYAGLTGLGAYVSSLLLIRLGLTPWIGIIIAGLVSAIMGMLIGLLTLRMNAVFTSIVSWFLGLLLMSLASSLTGLTRGKLGLNVDQLYETPWPKPYFFTAAIIAFVVFVSLRIIINSKLGLAFRALGQNYEAARTSGVNPLKYKLTNFIISCFIAGLAGGFYAHFIGIVTPDLMATKQIITVLVVAYLGGRGSIWGALVASLMLTPVLESLNSLLEFKFIIYGLLLIAVMIYYPGGLARFYYTSVEKIQAKFCGKNKLQKS